MDLKLLRRRPTKTSPLDSFESYETELTRSSHKQWESGIGNSSSFELPDDDFTFPIIARENKAVSFLYNYEVLGGVPSFVFRPIGNDKWAFRNFAVSSDGTRMALAIRPDIIHVYDLLENFTLIAKADYRWCIDFLDFWNSRNDMLVVVFENRVVSIIAVIDRRGSFSPSHSFTKDDISNLSFICNYHLSVDDDSAVHDQTGQALSNDVEMYWDFACEVTGSEMWLIQRNENGALFLNTVSQRNGNQHLTIFNDCCNQPTRLLSCISQRAVMAVYEHEDLRLNRTRIWRALIFEKGVKNQNPVELTGQGLCWGCNGKYLLIWSAQENRRNQVELYLTSELDPEEISGPLIAVSIGFGVISLKAQFLNKEVIGGEVDAHGVPLIALLVTRSNGISLLIWDCYINDIIMEKDLTIKQVEISDETRFEFCVSANLRWIAIGCWQTGVIGLFSFRSGSLIWTCELELCQIDDPCFIPMMFDPLSSKLIINSDNTLFVFIPPCLIEHRSIDFQSSSFDLDVKSQVCIPEFDDTHRKLLPKHVLGYLLALSLQSRVLVHSHYMYHIDIATSIASSKLAVLVSGATSVSIFLGTIEVFSSPAFRAYLEGIFSVDHISHNFDEIKIKDFPACPKFTSDGLLHYVFLYPSFGLPEESIAVFSLEDGVVGWFIDPANRKVQQKLNFATGRWLAAMQNKDNTCLTCLGEEGVLIVDLSRQLILQHVHYRSNLAHRLHCFFTHNWEIKHRPKNYTMRDILEEDLTATNLLLRTKKAGGFDISLDGKSILLGWDIIRRKRLLLTADLTNEDCEELQKGAGKLAPCWALDEDLEMVAYLEFDDNKDSISAIGTYNNQNEHHFRLSIHQWSSHLASIVQNVSTNDLLSYALQMDRDNGCLWLIILTKDGHLKAKTTWVPISPYSSPDCVPCFHSIGYPALKLQLEDLKMLTSKFDASSTFNMAFNGISNFQMVIEQKNESTLTQLITIASEAGITLDTRWKRWDGDRTQQSCLRKAIDKKDDLMSKVALDSLEKCLIPFQDTAFMFKECFEDLWTYYHTFMESILVKNLVSRPQCQVEVPLEIFNSEQYTGARLGTSNTILEWKHESNPKEVSKTWNHANRHHLDKIERRHGSTATRVLASMEFFSVDNICKLGLNGIIRFLLMQKAPSFIFKTNMIQSVIVWKWENLWKARCCRYFLLYLCFLILFSIYAVSIEFVDNKGGGHTSSGVFMSLLLFVLMLAAMLNLSKEYTQMKTYIRDGQILFPKSQLWGLKYYFISRWNIIEVVAYILLLFIIPVFHFLSYMDSTFMPVLYSVVAVEALLVYSKLWYFAQAFRQTGALVFMIENVLRDCMSFLLMAFVVLVGFSISIFIIVRHFLNDHTIEKDDDPMQAIHASFGSLLRVMVTLFYVMLGMFEPEVFFLCGSLSPLIIVIFVAYLSTQMIVMLNMLIAIMGDTFDRVKNSEEEQLLLGKARLIDACEAALTDDEIRRIEQGIGKYLYVLFPVGQPAHRDFNLWRGKPRSVEDNVRRIIDEHEEAMKSMIGSNHDDFMIRMQDAKDLLEMTMQTVGEFEKRSQEHASEIEKNLTRTIEERSKILEKYLIINLGQNPNNRDSSSTFRTTRVVMPDSLLRAPSEESDSVSSQSGSI